jgi:hypothetical protein
MYQNMETCMVLSSLYSIIMWNIEILSAQLDGVSDKQGQMG